MKILLTLAAISSLLFASCARDTVVQSNADAERTAGASTGRVEMVGDSRIPPPPQSGEYKTVSDERDWRNPSLVILRDGVGLTARAASITEPRRVAADELAEALRALPVAAWPDGGVVAVGEIGIRSGDGSDDELIARNRRRVEDALASLALEVVWLPSN